MAIIRVPYGDDGLPLPIEVPDGFLKVSNNPGGFVHNGSEVTLLQDSFGILPTVGSTFGDLARGADVNGKPSYEDATYNVSWDGAQWVLLNGLTSETFTNASTSTFPPESGWSVGSLATPAPDMSYGGNPWVSTGDYVGLDYPFFLAHPSGSGGLWLKLAKPDACVVAESGQYDSFREFTAAENDKTERYFKQGDCGAGFAALRDVDGELILDVGGNVIYTA